MIAVRRPGGHRPRPLRHLRQGRLQLRPAVRAAPPRKAQVVQLRLQRPTGQLCGAARQDAGRRRPPPRRATTDTEIIMHEIGRELSGDRRPTLVEVMRNVAKRFDGAYSIVLLERPGRHVRRPRSAGHQAAVLRHRRAAVRRGQRKRRAAEPGLLARKHSIRSRRAR